MAQWGRPDGQPWAQLLRVGGRLAARPGHRATGAVRVSGCPARDPYLAVPATWGVVRRIRRVEDRATRRPGSARLTDVPDTGWPAAPPPADPPAAADAFLSPEQYYARFGDRVPAGHWQTRGFLVDLDVAGS